MKEGGQNSPEWLMKDLKGILLSLEKALLEGEASKTRSTMLTQAREVLRVIEQDQLFNFASIRDAIGWHWFIPGLEDGGFQGGEVFSRDYKGGEGSTITLILQLSRLGLMKVDLSLSEKMINAKIVVNNEDTADFIDGHLQELKKDFEKKGLSPGFLKCEVDRNLDLDDIPAAWINSAATSLDLRI